jgi:hypothetical protein
MATLDRVFQPIEKIESAATKLGAAKFSGQGVAANFCAIGSGKQA